MASATPDPSVTILASEHHRPSTSTKLYCLVTKAGACKRAIIDRAGDETLTRDLSITSPNIVQLGYPA